MNDRSPTPPAFVPWLAAAAIFASAASVSAAPAARPNLLVIHTDEHHLGTLGCYGGSIVGTPNIDWLAAHGARCTSFYATTPVCSPSRSAFVTGRYPQNTPVVTNNVPMRDDAVTFAAILARQGYATGYAGKWHLDGSGKPQWAPERKFGFQDNRFMFNRGHWKKLEDTPDGPRVAARQGSYGVDGADETTFTTDWLSTKAIAFIEAHRDGPFCFMVSIPDPHGPNTVRAPYDTMYAGVKVPVPASLDKPPDETPRWGPSEKVTPAQLRRIMPGYWGMVKCIDDNVGRILDTLRQDGLMDRTVVVFTADHGDLCGEHGRLNKGVPYEGSARIPFVLYYPDRVPAGTVIDEALGCVDFLPTVTALMGIEAADPDVEGRDASALFTGETPEDWEDVTFLRSTSGNNVWLAAVTDRYKLVYSIRDVPWLFDLQEDPEELANRFNDPACRDVVRELTRQLADYCKRRHDPYGDGPKIKQDMAGGLR